MRAPLVVVLAFAVFQSLVVPADAQYLFLDVDGDGEYTLRDEFTFLRYDSWPIDLYLVTNESPGGPTVPCPDEIYSFKVHLVAAGASIVVENVETIVPGMTESFPMSAYPYAATLGYERVQPLGSGKVHLLRLTLRFEFAQGILGCPALAIVPSTCYAPEGFVTSVGTLCGDGYPIWGTSFYGCTDMTGHAPSIACPAEVLGREGETLTFQAVAIDPECGEYPFSFYSYGIPDGAVASPLSSFRAGQATQDITWTPGPGQAGEYTVTFDVSKPDPFNMTDRRSTCVTRLVIAEGNAAPVANAGGPYTGLTHQPVPMTGSASSDPDGDELSYSWDFGDGSTGAGVEVAHVYTSTGFYQVKLGVSDGVLYDEDGSTALVISALEVEVFVTGGESVLRLDSGKPHLCVSIEAKDFPIEYVELGSIEMVYGPSRISSAGEKTILGGDRNRNGLEEITACFTKNDLRKLFADVPPGTHDITVGMRARHQAGNPISGDLALTVVVRGTGSLSIMPNPLNPHGTISFVKSVPGITRISLFDVTGRLVRTVLESHLGAGAHSIPFDARELAAGVYFVRVKDSEGTSSRPIVIAR